MKRYVVLPASRTPLDKEKLKTLRADDRLANLSSVALELLYNRGFDTVEKIEKHLYSTIDDLHPAELLKDSDKFIDVLIQSIQNDEEVTIYGDYDVDGVGSMAIAYLALKNINVKVNYYANNRFDEGYGITPGGVDKMLEKYPNTKLIITTDNGIVAYSGVDRANELGLKVLITDHHDPASDNKMPNALAVVDAKRHDCEYPFKELCGAGLIFKLMLLLYQIIDQDVDYIYSLLDITALSTVADMVPLVDENRIIVKEGLKYHKGDKRLAFQKLREKLNITIVDEGTFGFTYGPIINALGRIDGTPLDAVELLTTNDKVKMELLVDKLVDINDIRKELTRKQEQLGEDMVMNYINKHKKLPYVIVLKDNSFHEGVVGLVAGRLKEKFYRPTIVLSPHHVTIDGKEVKAWKGSARSIDGFHIKKACDNVSDTLLGYGGHAMAGGLSVLDDKFDEFVEAINILASKTLTEEQLIKKIRIDTVLNSKRLTIKTIEDVDQLKPFGMGFVKPNYGFIAPNCEVIYMKKKDADVNSAPLHFKLIQDEISILGFNMVDKYKEMGEPANVKVIGTPSLNVFNGRTSIQFIIDYLELGERNLSTEIFEDDFEKAIK